MDEHLTDEPERWVQSCCVPCSNGCALDTGVKGGKMVGVRGRLTCQEAQQPNHLQISWRSMRIKQSAPQS